MSKFEIPYRITQFDTTNLRRLNASLQSIEKQLRYVPQETFKANRTLSLSPASFTQETLSTGGTNTGSSLKSSSATNPITFYANVDLLNSSVITSIVAYWYRDDALATGDCDLIRSDFEENESVMATADSDATTGFHSVTDTTISNATLDYDTYQYYVKVVLDPNDAATDVRFQGIDINYTVQV